MPGWSEETLSSRQRKWFASVREGLERDTGRTLDAWRRSPGPLPRRSLARAKLPLQSSSDVNAEVMALLRQAWKRSGFAR